MKHIRIKSLAIIGISLDKDKNRWNETIQEKRTKSMATDIR